MYDVLDRRVYGWHCHHAHAFPGGVNVHACKGKPGGGTNVNIGGKGGGVSMNTGGHEEKPVHVYVSPFIYK